MVGDTAITVEIQIKALPISVSARVRHLDRAARLAYRADLAELEADFLKSLQRGR